MEIDVELPLRSLRSCADGVDQVTMDLFRHLADQLVDIQSRNCVGDRTRMRKLSRSCTADRNRRCADPVLNLFGDDGDDLREGMQPLELFLAPRPVVWRRNSQPPKIRPSAASGSGE
ncbi:hypothetical protein MJ585_21875 [Klebsiella pneumoniae]|nr:hypothetical protein MJ585_21875 [Klebsiella pneumoniae]